MDKSINLSKTLEKTGFSTLRATKNIIMNGKRPPPYYSAVFGHKRKEWSPVDYFDDNLNNILEGL